MKRHRFLIVVIYLIFIILTIFYINSCGIYTVNLTLNAPYNISIASDSISFYGNNQEDSFLGYNIWYKKEQSDTYKICYYMVNNHSYIKPSLPKDLCNYDGTSPNIILMTDLYPQESNKSFFELYNNYGEKYYFAVSAYGLNNEESEKVEFGIWPNQ